MVKGQHYVPEFYLKRFAKNGKISVYNLLDGNIFSTDVNKIGKKSYFYDLEPAKLKEMLSEHKKITNISDIDFEELTNDVQFVENALSRLETKAGAYFNKFENDYTLINNKSFLSILFLFMRTLSIRTMSFRNGLENIAEQTTSWLKSLNIEEVRNYPLDMDPKDIAKINQLREITSLARTYDKSIKVFNNYNFYVGINNTKLDFLISDNPLLNFFLESNDICFPINPRLAIIMQARDVNLEPDKKSIINLSEKEVMKYNILQHNTNARYLFGSEEMLKNYKEKLQFIKSITRVC